MFYHHNQPRHRVMIGILISACLLATLVSFLSPQPATAQAHRASQHGPHISSAQAGFHDYYRDGNWVPVQITLTNDGTNDFTGKVSLNPPTNINNGGLPNVAGSSQYEQSVGLPPGSKKNITMYLPINTGYQGQQQTITINLLDSSNQKVSTYNAQLTSTTANELFIGVITDQQNINGITNALSTSSNFTTAVRTDHINLATLPSNADTLKNFDILVIDNTITGNLNKDQLAAIDSWVNQGGTLIEVGGAEWQHTLSPLPSDLVPVTVNGTGSLPTGSPLLPPGAPSRGGPHSNQQSTAAPSTVPISTATAHPGSLVLLSAENTPLIVQSNVGQGLVYYLAYDPLLDPLANWSGVSTIWEGLIIRSIGSTVLSRGNNFTMPVRLGYGGNDLTNLLQTLIPNITPPIWLILVLLLGYILVLGPFRLILVRWLKKRDWSWRIVLVTIVLFSLLSYGLALQEKGTSVINSSISIIQLSHGNTTNSSEHITNYVGVYVPNQGDFHVHVPGTNMVQAGDTGQDPYNPFGRSQAGGQRAVITSTPDGTDMDLLGVDSWTLRTLIASHDTQVQGGISSQLKYDANTLNGTVTNNLPYDMNDVYLLIGNDFVSLGDMKAGETKNVQHPVNANNQNSTMPGAISSLADQIAASRNVSFNNYNPYNPQPDQDETHRHMTMLSALSGEYMCNGPCYSNGKYGMGGMPVSAPLLGSTYTTGLDPLLVPGAPVTLIGWAPTFSDPASKITINGNSVQGTQENFIQAPLDATFSGTVNLSGLVTTQLVDIQQPAQQQSAATCPIQENTPNMYIMQTGSITFEFLAPNTPKIQNSSITLTELQNLNKTMGPNICAANGVIPSDVTHMQISLYNWQNNTWETKSFDTTFTLTVANADAYIGPDGRILVQFANQDTSIGSLVFNTPAISLTGTVSH